MNLFLILGFVELLLLAGLGWSGADFPLPGVPIFLLAFAAYLAAWRRVGALPSHDDRKSILAVWGLAVLMRLVLLPLEPRLSDDVYRYLWDGHVQLAGLNPYLFAPAATEVEHLRTSWHSLINNPSVPTIYPPLAQFCFALLALLGSTVVAAKVLWLTLDLAGGWLLVRVARESGRSPLTIAVLYLWSPLLVVETAWSGHLETLGLFGIAGVLFFDQRRRAGLTGSALGFSALAKFAPVAAVPALVRRYGVRVVVGVFGTLILGYLPYMSAGSRLWAGLSTYAEHWRFNEGAFTVLERLFAGPLAPRWVAGGLVVGAISWTVWKRMDAESALLWVLGTGIALSPTVHPWYVLWVLPVAALRGNRAWVFLSGSVFLAYWGLDTFRQTGHWPEPVSARLLIWVPFYGLLLWDRWRNHLERQLSEPQPQVPAQE